MMASQRKKSAPPVSIERGLDHIVIRPRNLLKAKAAIMLDGKASLDEVAIRRAEQALQALSSNFTGWMEDALHNLAQARDSVRILGPGEGRAASLHRAAHDIRGHATTLGFPLAARVGSSLSQLLEYCPSSMLHDGALTPLVDQHVDAIQAIIREAVTKATLRTGETLTAELEAMTERVLNGLKPGQLH